MKMRNFVKLSSLAVFMTINLSAQAQTYIDTSTSEATTPKPSLRNVEPSPQEDAIINKNILSHIKSSPTLSKLNINVKTTKGVVTISGNVDSDSQASSIIEIAQSIIGVKDIDADNLKVKSSSQPFADMMITAKIKGLFIREELFGTKDIASLNISVETKDGVVYLTGVIDNKEQIQNAIKLIEGVQGVKRVVYSVKHVIPSNTNMNNKMDNNNDRLDSTQDKNNTNKTKNMNNNNNNKNSNTNNNNNNNNNTNNY